MIRAIDLAGSFEEIIGWLYASPGSNDQSGIDCSGGFVRGYRKHGLSIAHGSNSIFRNHCSATGHIDGDASRLRVGMAVFKQRSDGQEPAKYQGDGIGNMYHIGLVTKASPLRIVHATPPAAKADTALGNWTHYGWLEDVDYSESDTASNAAPEMTEEEYLQESHVPASAQVFVKIFAANGKPVRIREKHDANIWKYEAPVGTVLEKTGSRIVKDRAYFKVLYLGKERLVDPSFALVCDAQGNLL